MSRIPLLSIHLYLWHFTMIYLGHTSTYMYQYWLKSLLFVMSSKMYTPFRVPNLKYFTVNRGQWNSKLGRQWWTTNSFWSYATGIIYLSYIYYIIFLNKKKERYEKAAKKMLPDFKWNTYMLTHISIDYILILCMWHWLALKHDWNKNHHIHVRELSTYNMV